MRRRLSAWLVAPWVLLGGCRAFVDLGGLDEAAPLAGDSGAASDVGTKDAASGDAPPSDAGRDASGDAQGPPFCTTISPAPLLCDDFEQDNGSLWTVASTRGSGVLDNTRGYASASSLKSHFASPSSETWVNWTSVATAPSSATTVRLEAMYYFEGPPPASADVEFSQIWINVAGVLHYVYLSLDASSGLRVYHEHEPIDGGAYFSESFSTGRTLSANTWYQLALEVDPAGRAARAYQDGALVGSGNVDSSLGAGTAHALAGAWMPFATSYDYWTDNIVFSAK